MPSAGLSCSGTAACLTLVAVVDELLRALLLAFICFFSVLNYLSFLTSAWGNGTLAGA